MPLSNMHGWSSGSTSITLGNISASTTTTHGIVVTGGGSSSGYASPYISGLTGTSAFNATTTITNPLILSGSKSDILIEDKSLRDWMSQVEKRLTILSPKPELLEKYEALQMAYDHYKTLEGLLYENPPDK